MSLFRRIIGSKIDISNSSRDLAVISHSSCDTTSIFIFISMLIPFFKKSKKSFDYPAPFILNIYIIYFVFIFCTFLKANIVLNLVSLMSTFPQIFIKLGIIHKNI